MADMLVKLYNIPDSRDLEKRLLEEGIRIKIIGFACYEVTHTPL